MNQYPERSWALPPSEVAVHFMNLFFRISQATAGLSTRSDKVYRYVEIFLWKFIDHFNSCFHLSNRTPILGRPQTFYDASSINVLVRAAWEAYLTFYYIYVQAESQEQRNFRFWGWWLAGLLDRRKALTFDAPDVLKMGLEAADITKIILDLQKNTYFDRCTPRQQEALTKHGRWRLASWTDIAVNAGFSRFLADQIYAFLCHYAHSGSASLLQLAEQPSGEQLATLNSAMLRIPLSVGAHFANDYCDLIDDPRVALTEEEKLFLVPWVRLAQLDPKLPPARTSASDLTE